mgnify:CR=1 FL=1
MNPTTCRWCNRTTAQGCNCVELTQSPSDEPCDAPLVLDSETGELVAESVATVWGTVELGGEA